MPGIRSNGGRASHKKGAQGAAATVETKVGKSNEKDTVSKWCFYYNAKAGSTCSEANDAGGTFSCVLQMLSFQEKDRRCLGDHKQDWVRGQEKTFELGLCDIKSKESAYYDAPDRDSLTLHLDDAHDKTCDIILGE